MCLRPDVRAAVREHLGVSAIGTTTLSFSWPDNPNAEAEILPAKTKTVHWGHSVTVIHISPSVDGSPIATIKEQNIDWSREETKCTTKTILRSKNQRIRLTEESRSRHHKNPHRAIESYPSSPLPRSLPSHQRTSSTAHSKSLQWSQEHVSERTEASRASRTKNVSLFCFAPAATPSLNIYS